MSKKIVLFGTGKIADVIFYCATHECQLDIAAFTLDEAYMQSDTFNGLPVVPFEQIQDKYPPSEYDMFIAIGYHDLNRIRAKKCQEATDKGYNLISVVSPLAHLPSNVSYGRNCFIMAPAIVHPCVVLGDNVFVWSGALVGHHSEVGNHNWITSGANIGGNVKVGENCFIAVNACIGHSVEIGSACFIGANTLVTKHLADQQVVIAESSKPIKLNSSQFLKFSGFSNL